MTSKEIVEVLKNSRCTIAEMINIHQFIANKLGVTIEELKNHINSYRSKL